jgi:GNAT superfamily N-acetyltransferase
VDVVLHPDLAGFLELVEPFYAADPVAHTLALTVLDGLRRGQGFGVGDPLLFSIHEDGELRGAALRTPPWPLQVHGVPAGAVPALVDAVAVADPDLPGVIGPHPAVHLFADVWSAVRGTTKVIERASWLYRLGELVPPEVPGTARPPVEADVPLLAKWRVGFAADTGQGSTDLAAAEEAARRSLGDGAQLLWEVDGTPVAWAGARGPVADMARVAPVYTPPELRGRGYGSAVSAAVSAWAAERARHVVLYADQDNAVANGIYQRLGYRQVLAEFTVTFS